MKKCKSEFSNLGCEREGKMPDFLEYATNVYRTKNYIVSQTMYLKQDEIESNLIVSCDTFFKRTLCRDKEYEILFEDRKHINGHRLPCNMSSRKYVD